MYGNQIGHIGRARDTAALHRELTSILGSNLVALYIPEDIVYNSLGNAISWKARIGSNLTVTDSATDKFKNNKTLLNGKDGIYPTGHLTNLYFSGTSSSYKYVLSVSNKTTLPFVQYTTILRSITPKTIVLEGTQNQIYLRSGSGWSHYIDGILTDNCTTGTHIYEATNTVSHVGIFYGGNPDGSYQWRDGIGLLLLCSEIPTETKAIQVRNIINQYYASSYLQPLDQQLINIFGSDLIGLWLGDDLVTDENGDVTSWPDRIDLIDGYELTNTTANRFKTSIIGGKKFLIPNGIATSKSLYSDFADISKSIWALSYGCTASTAYETLADTYVPATNNVLNRNSTLTTWFGADWSRWNNATNVNSIPTSGLYIFGADNAANTETGISVGGWCNPSGVRVWPQPIGMLMALKNVPTLTNRLKAITAILTTYNKTKLI